MTSFFSKNTFNPQSSPVPQKPVVPFGKPVAPQPGSEQRLYLTRPQINKEIRKYTLHLNRSEKAKIIPKKYGRNITKTDIIRAQRGIMRTALKAETAEQKILLGKEKRILKKIERKLEYP